MKDFDFKLLWEVVYRFFKVVYQFVVAKAEGRLEEEMGK